MSGGEIKFQGNYEELVRHGVDMEMLKATAADTAEETKDKLDVTASHNNSMDKSAHIENGHVETMQLLTRLNSQDSTKQHVDSAAMNFVTSSEILDLTSSHMLLNRSQLLRPTDNAIELTDKPMAADTNYDEAQQHGLLNWRTYFLYFKLGGGIFGAVLNFLIFMSAEFSIAVTDYWVSYWASLEAIDMSVKQANITSLASSPLLGDSFPSNESLPSTITSSLFEGRTRYYGIYCLLLATCYVLGTLRTLTFYQLCMNASRSLHKRMIRSVLATPVRFFDLNPIGRLMNRFSKDMSVLDENIPQTVFDFMHCAMLVISPICVIVYLNQSMLIPLVVVLVLFLYIRKYCLVSLMELKRIENVNRSPIYVHVNNTIGGLATIRAARRQDTLVAEFYTHCDYHTRSLLAFFDVARWMAVQLGTFPFKNVVYKFEYYLFECDHF